MQEKSVSKQSDDSDGVDDDTQSAIDLYSKGFKFPSQHENQGILNLIEVIMEKYRFLHP